MEKQSVLLFRQKNRWGLTVLSIVACLLLSPIVGMAAMLPQILAVVPVLLLALLGSVGPVSAVVCSGLLVGVAGTLFGIKGALCALVLFVPVLGISAYLVEKRYPFWHSAGVSACAMFASMGAVVGIVTLLAGSDLVTVFTNMMREMFDSMGALADSMLLMFAQMGIYVPEGLDLTKPGVALSPEMREEMVNMIVLVMDSGLRLELPAQMATGSLTAGVLGQAFLRKGVLRRGIQVPYPRLHTWRLPKGWGRVLGGTLLLFYLLAQMLPERMNSTLYVFTNVFDTIFVTQGIAAVCYLLHKNGRGRFLKGLVAVVGFVALKSIALAVGVADQAVDITHRRQELDQEENPYDPFGRKPDA